MDQEQVRQLVWEMIESGKSAEDVCRDCPDLVSDVRRQWQRVRAVEEQLEAFFPSSDSPGDQTPELPSDLSLPKIPGYEIQSVLGRGGMGVVYKARHLSLDRTVAIKVPLTGDFATAAERQRHMREAQAVAALRHPNIITVHDVGEFEGRPYFTMEFIDGQHLGARLANTPQPTREAASLVATLADAAHCAHQAGIIHRDLKPANVLLALDGAPKITDFGLARQTDREATLTAAGFQFGTPSYMSPEQARGEPAAQSSSVDIYSLGSILYEALTGRPPFRGENAIETVRQVLEDEPAPPSRLNPRTPRDLETICLKCLHKDPVRRYTTAAELASDLNRFLRGEPIHARRTSRIERSAKWARRHPGVTVAAVSMSALLATAVVVTERSLWSRAELSRGVNADLAEVERFERISDWSNAREVLERAKGRLGDREIADARARIHQSERDLKFVEDVTNIRLNGAEIARGQVKLAEASEQYDRVFTAAGLDVKSLAPEVVADRIRASPIRSALIAALDDWSTCAPTREQVERIYEVTRRADPDPDWRDKVRDVAIIDDVHALTTLADEAAIDQQSPSLLVALGRRLERVESNPVGFCKRVQLQYPNDFWVNLQLANILQKRGNPESIGYHLAARAIRPDALIVSMNLGAELTQQGRTAEAIEYARRAVEIDPRSARVHANLGVCFTQFGKYEEAVACCRTALAIDPSHMFAVGVMCQSLMKDGRFTEANTEAQRWLDSMPKDAPGKEAIARLVVVYTDLLERERQLMDVLSGREEVTPHRRRQLASVCLLTKRYSDAVRFYEEAFAAEPALADDILSQVRLEAASAAVMTAEQLSDPHERGRLLNSAVAWLRADLNVWSGMLAAGRENERQAVLRGIYPWRWEPRLASIRETDGLRGWPAEQQALCRTFWREVETLIARAQMAAPPADASVLVGAGSLKQARELAAKGDWSGAARWYAQSQAQSPTDDGEFWFEYAAVLLLSGDRSAYRSACAHMVSRGGIPGIRAYHVARAVTLGDDGLSDDSVLDKLSANSELKINATQFWAQTALGALAYRANRFEDAAELFERSLKTDQRPGRAVVNWVWLAVAQHRIGNTDEAHRWLDRAQQWLDQYQDGLPPNAEAELGLHFHNWLEANTLRREAEEMLRSK